MIYDIFYNVSWGFGIWINPESSEHCNKMGGLITYKLSELVFNRIPKGLSEKGFASEEAESKENNKKPQLKGKLYFSSESIEHVFLNMLILYIKRCFCTDFYLLWIILSLSRNKFCSQNIDVTPDIKKTSKSKHNPADPFVKPYSWIKVFRHYDRFLSTDCTKANKLLQTNFWKSHPFLWFL